MRMSLALCFAVFVSGCASDSFAVGDGGTPPGSDGGDAAMPPPDGGGDGMSRDAAPACGGAPCAGTCVGDVCQLVDMQDVRCLRVVERDIGQGREATVFFITKSGFGRVSGAGGTPLLRDASPSRDYATCTLSSNQNSVYAADPQAGAVDSYSTALAGGTIPMPTAVLTNQFQVRALASALPWLFWNAGDQIMTCNLQSCTPSVVTSGGPVIAPNLIAIDGVQASGKIYFATTGPAPDIRTVAANVSMAPSAQFLPLLAPARSMILSGGDVFVAVAGDVMRVDKAMPSMLSTIASGRTEPGNLVADLTSVYWTEGGSGVGAVMRAFRNGAQLTKLADAEKPAALDVDSTHVYFAAKNGIYRAPKP
jgi:hypothetical protein